MGMQGGRPSGAGAQDDHRLGFRTLDSELAIDSLPLEGKLPGWLEGSLYRVGPARFEAGERSLNHWFDGFSMLHRFSVSDGSVSYANRFLASRAYRAAAERGRISYSEFATDPCRSLFGRLAALFRPPISDNANVNLTRLGGELVAMTETPMPVIFDPRTLATAGVASRSPGEHTTAHPHRDRRTGEALFYAVKFGPRSSYRLFSRSTTTRCAEIARWPAPRPSYMHSFGLSERFAVLTECPFVVNPLDLVLSGRPFIENYRWRPGRGTTITVIDTERGEVHAQAQAEPFFCFHHVNAFRDGGELVIDLIAYEDAEIVRSLYLAALRDGAGIPAPELRRYRMPLAGGEARAETLARHIELPRINYSASNGRPYRYLYGQGAAGPGAQPGFATAVKKVDVEAGSTSEWSEPGAYPGEPVFVPAPAAGNGSGAPNEDDGVLLSVVLEPAAGTSFLLVLDARDLSELCRARVPHPIPFGFHGEFFSE